MSNRLLYVVTVLIWGSTWIAIEYQLGVVAPVVSVFFRYALAAALLFGWCLTKGANLRFDRTAHVRFVLLGLLLFCLNYILTYQAQKQKVKTSNKGYWYKSRSPARYCLAYHFDIECPNPNSYGQQKCHQTCNRNKFEWHITERCYSFPVVG